MTATIVWTLAVFVLDFTLPMGVAVPMLYVVGVLVTLWSPLRSSTWGAAVVGTVMTGIGFFLSPSEDPVWMGILNRALAILMVWVSTILILVFKENRKALRGFLPICACCKKIQDGRDVWKELEAYIEEHTEAIFSHGLCVTCFKEWYPKQYGSMRVRNPEFLDRRNGS